MKRLPEASGKQAVAGRPGKNSSTARTGVDTESSRSPLALALKQEGGLLTLGRGLPDGPPPSLAPQPQAILGWQAPRILRGRGDSLSPWGSWDPETEALLLVFPSVHRAASSVQRRALTKAPDVQL